MNDNEPKPVLLWSVESPQKKRHDFPQTMTDKRRLKILLYRTEQNIDDDSHYRTQ